MGSPENKNRPVREWETRVRAALATRHDLPFICDITPQGEPVPNFLVLGFDWQERGRLKEEGARKQDEVIVKQVNSLSDAADTNAATDLIAYYRQLCMRKGIRLIQGDKASDGLTKEIEEMEKKLDLPSETALLEAEVERRILGELDKLGL